MGGERPNQSFIAQELSQGEVFIHVQLAVAEDVILHQEEDDAFLLHITSGRYFGLNASGLVVWHALVGGADPVREMAQRWPDRSEQALRADVDQLVEQLQRAGLVSEVADERER